MGSQRSLLDRAKHSSGCPATSVAPRELPVRPGFLFFARMAQVWFERSAPVGPVEAAPALALTPSLLDQWFERGRGCWLWTPAQAKRNNEATSNYSHLGVN